MSTKQQKRVSVTVDRFRGICSDAPKGGTLVADDIRNFRINSDGSLEKRCGMTPLFTSRYDIGPSIVVRTDGELLLYMLQDVTVLRLNLRTGSCVACGYVEPKTESACFFYLQGALYLLCDESLYLIEDKKLSRTIGYIPLVGKDWKNNVTGEIYEPRNLLHNTGRITYVIADPPSIFLHSPYPVKSIQRVIRNGVELSTEEYHLDPNFNTINVLSAAAGDRITVYLTFEEDDTQKSASLYRCKQSLPVGSADACRLLLFDGTLPSTVFFSTPVSEESLKQSRQINSVSSALYFPKGSDMIVGDGQYKLQGAAVDRDHILFFTTGSTHVAKNPSTLSEPLATYGVYPVGCASVGGVLRAGSSPVSVGTNTIYRWQSANDGTLHPVSISGDIDRLLDGDFYSRAQLCYDSARGELWVGDPQAETVWVCRTDTGDWVRYTSIPFTRLTYLYDRMGLIHGGDVFVFDESIREDVRRDNTPAPFKASFSASLGDLGTPDRKTLSHLILHGYVEGEPLEVFIWGGDLYDPISAHMGESEERRYAVLKRRCPSGRFTHTNVIIEADGGSYPLIQSLSIHTK